MPKGPRDWGSGSFAKTSRRQANVSLLALAVGLALPACVGVRRCPEPSPERLSTAPQRLSDTGLYTNIEPPSLAQGVMPYRPRFELWADGAAKQRWIYLPPGGQIDTADPDAWQFPEGTKLWKEFSKDGRRIETRLMQKVGPDPDAWLAVAYVWDAQGHDAVATTMGQQNAGGSSHDVPPARHCMACHAGSAGRVLGFSAIQLAHASADEISLQTLSNRHLLTTAVPKSGQLPGDALTQQVLGYLHANCGHCHGQGRASVKGPRCFDPRGDLDLSLRVAELRSVADTGLYRTALDDIIERGDPDHSALIRHFSRHGFFWVPMPPLATEQIDVQAAQMLRAWISQLHDSGPKSL